MKLVCIPFHDWAKLQPTDQVSKGRKVLEWPHSYCHDNYSGYGCISSSTLQYACQCSSVANCINPWWNTSQVYAKQSLQRPWGFNEFEVPRFARQSAHEGGKVVSPMHQTPLCPRKYSWCSFLLHAQSIQVHSVARRNTSKENSSDTTGNRTCDLLARSEAPQPTVPPCAYFSSICQVKTDGKKYADNKNPQFN